MSNYSETFSAPEEEEMEEEVEGILATKWRQRFVVMWYFGRAIQIPFLSAKWHNFESL